MQKPFDVNSIMDDLDAALVEAPHDTIGTGPRTELPKGRWRSPNDSDSIAPRSQDPSTAVQEAQATATSDPVNHPVHYVSHPSGVECIIITEWMNFNLGNAVKYIWRANDKGATIQDLEKARWYLDREISRLNRLMETK